MQVEVCIAEKKREVLREDRYSFCAKERCGALERERKSRVRIAGMKSKKPELPDVEKVDVCVFRSKR